MNYRLDDPFTDYWTMNGMDVADWDRFPAIHITFHARRRFAERTDIPETEVNLFVQDAVLFGRCMSSYSGPNLRFMYEKASGGLWPITYRGLMLLFSPIDYSLVTVYPLPSWFFNELPCVNPKETFFTRIAARMSDGLTFMRNLYHQIRTGRPDVDRWR